MPFSAKWLPLALALTGSGAGGAEHHPRLAPPPVDVAAPTVQPTSPAELAQQSGPHGTSGEGESRYDAVGYAALAQAEAGPVIVTEALPADDYAEVTALESGRTVLARVAAGSIVRGRVVGLSRDIATALGVHDGAAVRVRQVVPTPPDEAALRNGRMATPRPEAPPVLLVALRRRLAPMPDMTPAAEPVAASAPPHRRVAAPPATTAFAAPSTGRYFVQVAALSNRARADALARDLGGHVDPVGPLFRVRVGPFPNAAAAKRARDDVARRGYADARVAIND